MFADERFVREGVTRKDLLMTDWIQRVDGKKIAIIEIGAGTTVSFIRRNSKILAETLSAPLIQINTSESDTDGFGVGINLQEL